MHGIENKRRYVGDPIEINLQNDYFAGDYKKNWRKEFKWEKKIENFKILYGSNNLDLDFLIENGNYLPSSGFEEDSSSEGEFDGDWVDLSDESLAEEVFYDDLDSTVYEAIDEKREDDSESDADVIPGAYNFCVTSDTLDLLDEDEEDLDDIQDEDDVVLDFDEDDGFGFDRYQTEILIIKSGDDSRKILDAPIVYTDEYFSSFIELDSMDDTGLVGDMDRVFTDRFSVLLL